MFDVVDQAHGLQAFAPVASTRVLVVPATAHGGVAHRLLWLLARRLAGQGEQVLVIDGMANETPGAGLLGLLDAAPGAPVLWPGDWTEDAVTGVHILPGRLGLQQLGRPAQRAGADASLSLLAQALPQGVFVLLTAPVEVLAVLLRGSQARPLVPLDGQPRTLVEAYNTAKVLLQAGDLLPVLVPMAGATRGHTGGLQALEAPVQALAQCARTHLGEDLQIWPVAYDESRDTSAQRVPEAWWHKVLDSALVVTTAAWADGIFRPDGVDHQPDDRRC